MAESRRHLLIILGDLLVLAADDRRGRFFHHIEVVGPEDGFIDQDCVGPDFLDLFQEDVRGYAGI